MTGKLMCVVLLLAHQQLQASSEQVLIECSSASVDERGIEECLAVTVAQAETALSAIENRWQQWLESEDSNPDAEPAETTVSATSATLTGNSRVISIVNDTALQSGLSARGGNIINIDDDTLSLDRQDEVLVDEKVDRSERFSFLPALFRSFRDQHCAWEASLFGSDRVEPHYKACLVAQTRSRTKVLNGWLAARRVLAKEGRSYRGYYVKTSTGAVFQACDRKTDWWVTGSDAIVSALDRRYADISDQGFNTASDLLYAELRGNVRGAPASGSGADYRASLLVSQINLLRPLSNSDCSDLSQHRAEQGSFGDARATGAEISSAATVDDYASAGFLYGYFNVWLSACAVTQNSVCSAETDAQFASDGEWQLRVDRSVEGDWRIQLISTTDDQVIERQLKMQIDGVDVYLGNSVREPLPLPMRQGVDIAVGELAREFIIKLREGREVRFEWLDESDVMSEIKFSLLGVTRALQFFDQSKP